ncbi:enoyl-CoA hydratase-related protein [Gordonia westfalica]|uniref:Enoyl-CoA hydratase-related protein n=1 Tax=Gordonia westfalica TaxID=158898 RepID=A0ABU2GYR3_9ACTN|nr:MULTISPECIES: enoyl-CoA hydratase-related protein [Gordonia]MDS1116125.1 enoyl-CoA hydratase-related protein [Gordonia westfalica]QMU22355.1 enoyl-CoA hydratase/isomerase family protein [Gordonia rubripertincta]
MIDWTVTAHSETLETANGDGVRRLTLSRPEALNAFDETLQSDLLEAVAAAATDDTVRCVVLTGRGRAFCAGADLALDGLGPDVRLAPRTERELTQFYNPIVRGLRETRKPVVAAVNGAAVGVGCAVALACDHVVGARSASFTLAFSRVGLTLDGGASLLVGARVGFGRASRMALLAERVDADTAFSWGLIDAVVDDADLTDHVESLARKLAAGPTEAYAATKRSLNAALLHRLEDAFEVEVAGQTALVDGPGFRTAITRFTGSKG